MKTITPLLVGLVSVGVCASLFAEPTLEERVAALEKKVAELENKSQKTVPDSGSAGDRKVVEAKKGVIFQDGFEAGVSNWKEEIKYSAPEGQDHKAFKIGAWEKFRATKELRTQSGVLDPVEGKRFLTGANEKSGVIQVNNSWDRASTVNKLWRAVHYCYTKEGVDLGSSKLPVAKLKLHLQLPKEADSKQQPYAFIEFGYFTNRETVSHFKGLKTYTKTTNGWESIEIDLSSIPKDRPVHFAFRYVCADSRVVATAGFQMDDVNIIDDGQ